MKKNVKLKAALFQADMTQKDLATEVGIQENILSWVVNGRFILTEDEQEKIAEVLNMDVYELFE